MSRRARWYLVPLVAALFATPFRQIDAQSISFGLTAGASLSTFTGDFAKDAANNTTFIGGAFVRLSAVGFAIQPGLYYTGKGAKFQENTPEESTTKLDYIQIPIVIRIHMGPLYVGAGPAIGLKLSCTTAATSGTSSDCPSTATSTEAAPKSTEISGILEAGVEIGKLSIGARADLGLTNALEALQTGNTSNVTAKTRTLSALVAVRF